MNTDCKSDESGQEKSGTATAGVKRQYVGCVGKIANAVNVVYASYASRPEHALVATIAAYVRWRNARARLKNQLRRRLIDPHLDQFPSPMR